MNTPNPEFNILETKQPQGFYCEHCGKETRFAIELGGKTDPDNPFLQYSAETVFLCRRCVQTALKAFLEHSVKQAELEDRKQKEEAFEKLDHF